MTASVSDVISAVSIFVLGALGLGFTVSYPFFRKQQVSKSLFGNFVLGVTCFYGLVLCQIKFSTLSWLFLVFILTGGGLLYWRYRHKIFVKTNSNSKRYFSWLSTLAFIGISVWLSRYLIERILYEPIFQWDARVNWFFYAKKFFYADGLNSNTGIIYDNAISESLVHPGYPKIVPVMGGYFAKYFGFWNDHLPKLSLLILYIGVLIGLYCAKAIHWIWKIILLVLLIGFMPYMQSTANNTIFLSIGYMDQWMSIYVSLSLIYLSLYLQYFQKEYLFNGVAGMLLVLNIKNEGSLLMVMIVSSFTFCILLFNFRNRRFLATILKRLLRFSGVFVIGIIPYGVWNFYKKQWNIGATDYPIYFEKFFDPSAYPEIFSDARLQLIEQQYINRVTLSSFWWLYAVLLIGAIVYLKIIKITPKTQRYFLASFLAPTLAGLGFIMATTTVFCLVPFKDLEPYLLTGADRVGLHSYYLLSNGLFGFVSAFFFFPFKKRQQMVNSVNPVKTRKERTPEVKEAKPVKRTKKRS